MVWWVWFRLKRPAWLPKAVVVLTLLYMVSQLLGEELIFGLVPHPVAVKFHLLSAVVRLAFLALLVLIVVLGVRQQGREGWVVLPAVFMFGMARFQNELGVLHIRAIWFPFGIQVTVSTAATLLLVLALFILLLRHMFVALRAKREQALDIKQAIEVQQVILPESRLTFPHLFIETEYRPARDVGGDFFQIIPSESDGSLLIVAGDVTGKGLQAGMLVALLIGAIRSTAELNPNPLFLLEALNRRLLGRQSAQATCLALPHLRRRRSHPGQRRRPSALPQRLTPPYGGGPPSRPLRHRRILRHALPPQPQRQVSPHLRRHPRSHRRAWPSLRLRRIQQLLQEHISLTTLVDAAQRFGQQDDISLISLTRTGA